MSRRKDTKVVYRNLGKEKAWGIAHIGNNKIEIDPRLSGRKHIEILLHEKIHLQNPEWSETKVLKQSKDLAKFLWQNQIRWVDL
jgi:hypothetical protein